MKKITLIVISSAMLFSTIQCSSKKKKGILNNFIPIALLGNSAKTVSSNSSTSGQTASAGLPTESASGTNPNNSQLNNENAPSKPSSIQIVNVQRSQIDISWTASSSTKVPQNSLVYEICRSKVQGGCDSFNVKSVTAPGTTSYSAVNLSTGTHYFRIRARDSFNNYSALSEEVNASPVWNDPVSDTRTDISSPENKTDILQMEITSDSSNLIFIFKMANLSLEGPPPQIQIAIDKDQIPSSGQTYFTAFADTQVSPNAAWEKLIQTQFHSGNSGNAEIIGTDFNQISCTAINTLNTISNTISISVPWSCLGYNDIPTSTVRFTIAPFRSYENSNLTFDIGGPSVSNVLDAFESPYCNKDQLFWNLDFLGLSVPVRFILIQFYAMGGHISTSA